MSRNSTAPGRRSQTPMRLGMLCATLWMLMAVGGASATGNDRALIVDSGSTNTLGYQIEVDRAGKAVIEAENGRPLRTVTLNRDLVVRFFAALDADAPLNSLPRPLCGKSRSFGYTIVIHYQGETSPDLTCRVSDATLARLAHNIARAADVADAAPRRPSPSPRS